VNRNRGRARPFRSVRALLLSLSVAATLVATGTTSATAAAPGPFVTLLFSRTEMTGAIDCTPSATGVARLDTTVAPFLRSMGLTGTGTLETAQIRQSARVCVPNNWNSLMASWADATMLSTRFGWSFVSHTATYPETQNISSLPPGQQWDETCGSALAIDAHGLHGGHGLIAYPGAFALPVSTQQNFAQHCFAWGRRYDPAATTPVSAASTPPYWQQTGAFNGGPCNARTAPCYRFPLASGHRYTLPSTLIARVRALTPGTWATLQAFVLVTGTNPSGSTLRWDCRSANPARHWTNDNERYCYRDWQAVVRAVAARPAIRVTDPLTVGIAWGRPAAYSFPRP
jgi:hypothetical protein